MGCPARNAPRAAGNAHQANGLSSSPSSRIRLTPTPHPHPPPAPRPVPPSDPASVPWKILMDQTIYAAVKYSMYLGLVGLATGCEPQECGREIQQKLWPTLTTGWRFWPAVHIVTYNLIPPRHRVLWVNCADLIWVTVMASIARCAGAASRVDARAWARRARAFARMGCYPGGARVDALCAWAGPPSVCDIDQAGEPAVRGRCVRVGGKREARACAMTVAQRQPSGPHATQPPPGRPALSVTEAHPAPDAHPWHQGGKWRCGTRRVWFAWRSQQDSQQKTGRRCRRATQGRQEERQAAAGQVFGARRAGGTGSDETFLKLERRANSVTARHATPRRPNLCCD